MSATPNAERLELLRAAQASACAQADPALLERLTDAEFSCIVGLMGGLQQKQLADVIHRSPKTVHTIYMRMYAKLGVRNYAGLLSYTYAVLEQAEEAA